MLLKLLVSLPLSGRDGTKKCYDPLHLAKVLQDGWCGSNDSPTPSQPSQSASPGGVLVTNVRKQLGHSNIQSTLLYAEVVQAIMKQDL